MDSVSETMNDKPNESESRKLGKTPKPEANTRIVPLRVQIPIPSPINFGSLIKILKLESPLLKKEFKGESLPRKMLSPTCSAFLISLIGYFMIGNAPSLACL
ncbi:hypothetical protein COLO4_01244 [Corchorus olitorius]|uniref:Uncharacterized protein n=1 Tax=Corchorus olitorius TaxID=93759 RepID=A0A1R3L2S5_9ROSI|nr:hypothetical protein COLO4_01244 [Corchorus olitorius]